MIDEVQVRDIVKKVLKEGHLDDFIKIFEKEHNLFRGSHDKIALPENLEIPEKIITQIIAHAPGTFKELDDTDIPEHLTGDFVQYDEGIEKWKRIPALTQGSILFPDADGYFIEDNTNLVWNNDLKVLEVSCPTTPAAYWNTYIGKGVIGAGNSVGKRNVMLGYEAGRANIAGSKDVFIGHYAGRSNTSGEENVLIGGSAGYYITTSPENTCIGFWAGIAIETGDGKNVCIGAYASSGATGKENVGVGCNSLAGLMDGSRNTAIGHYAGPWYTDSWYGIAIGYHAYSKENNLCAIGGLGATDSVNLAIFYNREFRFYDTGNNYVGFKAPLLDANQIWVLPAADADAVNKCLMSDSAGALGWSQALGVGNSPTFITAKLTALTDGYVPYHVSDALGLDDSPIRIDGTKVGIGVAPGNALHVAGNIQVNTNSQKIHSNIWEVVNSQADMKFRIGQQDAMIIQRATFNVGIGLTPTANMLGLSIEAGLLTLKERATPTADGDYGKIYTKDDNKLYFQDGAGIEHEVAYVP